MKTKTLLILGMGHSQVDLAVAAREYGAKVYACAHNVNGPAKIFLDGCKEIDILDIDGIVDYAKEIKADAIFTVGLEIALKPIAEASERLGLNTFFSSRTIDQLGDKIKWRKKLGNIAGNLNFTSGNNLADFKSWAQYPAILKPADGSGQRGVVKVNNFQELETNFNRAKSFSKSGLLILEEFAYGDEISVNSLMEKGELKFAVMSDRISHKDVPGGIIKEHHIPSKYDYEPLATKVKTLVENVNKIMGFRNGHIYFQLKIMDGDVSLIEFTPRFDGCHMWRLIKTACGIDLLQASLEILFEGYSKTLSEYKNEDLTGQQYILKFNSDIPGKLVKYNDYKIQDNASFNCWYYREGEKVKTVTSYLEKVGYYIYSKNSYSN